MIVESCPPVSPVAANAWHLHVCCGALKQSIGSICRCVRKPAIAESFRNRQSIRSNASSAVGIRYGPTFSTNRPLQSFSTPNGRESGHCRSQKWVDTHLSPNDEPEVRENTGPDTGPDTILAWRPTPPSPEAKRMGRWREVSRPLRRTWKLKS